MEEKFIPQREYDKRQKKSGLVSIKTWNWPKFRLFLLLVSQELREEGNDQAELGRIPYFDWIHPEDEGVVEDFCKETRKIRSGYYDDKDKGEWQ